MMEAKVNETAHLEGKSNSNFFVLLHPFLYFMNLPTEGQSVTQFFSEIECIIKF